MKVVNLIKLDKKEKEKETKVLPSSTKSPLYPSSNPPENPTTFLLPLDRDRCH